MLVSLSNTSAFPTSTSSTVTSASLSSFNCSSGNTASNAECTFFLKNVSTKVMWVLFSLCVFQIKFQMERRKGW